jgi:hypothetical protein
VDDKAFLVASVKFLVLDLEDPSILKTPDNKFKKGILIHDLLKISDYCNHDQNNDNTGTRQFFHLQVSLGSQGIN